MSASSTCNRIPFRVLPLAIAACLLAAPLQADPPASVTYTYDELGRLRTGVFDDGRKADYQYDPAGNRTSMVSGFPAQLSIAAAASVNEGSNLVFPVTMTRTGPSTGNITVSCVPQNGTAQSAPSGASQPFDDYVTTPQTVTFLPSDPSPATKNCVIATKTDSYYEGTQFLTATLQNSVGAVITPPGAASGSILDLSTPPNFIVVAAPPVAEGNGASFTVSRIGFSEATVSVSYSTADGSATAADSDYTAVPATVLSFPGTIQSQSATGISVQTIADTKFEGTETFTVNLSAPSSPATLGSPSSATGTINNDDPPPVIAILDPPAVTEGQQLVFTVQKGGNTNTAFTHSMSWATANGTATAGSDYVAASGTVDFAPSETSKTIAVQTLTDGVYEPGVGGTENFLVNLSTNANTNGALISTTDPSGNGVIFDLDNPTPSQPAMTSPAFRQDTDGSYGVNWTDSSGPLAYYVLEEEVNGGGAFASFNVHIVNAPTSIKSFSNQPSGEWRYRVKACTAGGACSGYSGVILVLVCVGGCQ